MSGVGIKFDGYPTDENQFAWILAQSGCHPKATCRILERIKENGFDLLTITERVDTEWVRKALEPLSVEMTYIPAKEDWFDRFNDGAWPEALINQVLSERDRQRGNPQNIKNNA